MNITGTTSVGAKVTRTSVTGKTYTGAVTITGSTVNLDSSSGNGVVLFSSTVDSAASAAKPLTVSAGSGNVTFTGVVGGATNGALGALTVNTSGITTFSAAVTAASVTTDAGGTLAINGGTVTTSGAQTYNDAATLGADTTLNTTNSNIAFASTLNSTTSARALTIGAGSGTVTFTGAVGGTTALGATNITAATTTNATTLRGSGVYAITGNAVISGAITGVSLSTARVKKRITRSSRLYSNSNLATKVGAAANSKI